MQTTAALLVGTRIQVNGVQEHQLTDNRTVAADRFESNAIVTLTAGDTLTPQFFGLLGNVSLDGTGAARMSIAKLG